LIIAVKNRYAMKKLILLFMFQVVLSACNTGFKPTKVPPGDEVILGIFGGMGPEATADLYLQILKLTPATADQQHIPAIIFSNPVVPDRVTAIETGDKSIIPYLTFSVRKLEDAGASFIAIPCNTVHYFFDYMQDAVSIPIINMIRETANVVAKQYPGIKKVGLLATSGTIRSGLYEKELKAKGYEVIVPEERIEEEMVMKAVRGIKAGTDRKPIEDLLAVAGRHLADRGAELIVLGCTEIPLGYNPERVDLPVVNATKVLAEKAVSLYFEKTGKK
jgi:aspartate racemase